MDYNNNFNQNKLSESGYTYVQGLGFVPFGPAYQERTSLITCANAAGLAVLLYLFLRVAVPAYVVRFFMLFMPQIRYFNSHLMAPEWITQIIDGLSFLLCNFVAYGLYLLFIRIPVRVALPLKRPQAAMTVPAVFIALAVSVLGSAATAALSGVMSLAGLIPIMPDISVSVTPVGLIAALVNICILPAIVEEFVFRGVLMQSLRRFGDGFALAVSAIVFSLLHLNFMQAPIALLMGMVIGYFVIRTGTLWTGIIIHFVNNLLALAQQIVLPMLTQRQAEIVNLTMVLLYLILGLISTILLARSSDDLFRLKTVPSSFTVRQRTKMFFSCPAMIIAIVLIASFSLQSIQRLPR
ncbi:CPBP family intramembrane glutamic endopeptidase [Hydrogenoanaerobacterium sp.]|uniref:CPBP family intramembrane glutamic endopeptidase n=1 Tax=Hydrogenoanaerobacterium sp. TaxID=2953763 RepID=UPI00289C48E6|nr:CPBP family intramembrane glutamic endopeptidase [Hydrogenoanaerobacterium sp.]